MKGSIQTRDNFTIAPAPPPKTKPSSSRKKTDNEELFRVKSSRLLDIFPDEIIVQKKAISLIRREFLLTYTETIPLGDIRETILSQAGPFAALTLVGKNPDEQIVIRALPTDKAIKAKEIIDKLLLAR